MNDGPYDEISRHDFYSAGNLMWSPDAEIFGSASSRVSFVFRE
jgi:hypothetical protein